MDNSSQLKLLMIKHDVKPEEVAKILNRELSTVYQWSAKNVHAQIPDALLELLKYKLESR